MSPQVVAGVAKEEYALVMCNFAPPDMVGHTGVYDAAVQAVEATDTAIGKIYEACMKHNYVLFVTADHGNAEQMISPSGGPHTAHTCNRGTLRGPYSGSRRRRRFLLTWLAAGAAAGAPLPSAVPFVMAFPPNHPNPRKFAPTKDETDRKLADVAPTVLAVMGLPIPQEMDGRSLLA